MSNPAFYFTRTGGLGDVLMALAAIKAAKEATGARTHLITIPAYRALALACPHLDQVISTSEEGREALADIQVSANAGRVRNLDSASYGTENKHQVDAFLTSVGLGALAKHKSVDLTLEGPPADQAAALLASFPPPPAGGQRVLLHPAAGDPNRTWPNAHWCTVAQELLEAGHQVIRVGHNSADPHRGIQQLPVAGVLEGADRLNALGFAALCAACDLLVSTDSGPVQLAGATDIAIVGIYSVVPGRCRLPFRHGQAGWRAEAVEPSCIHFPCYHLLNNEEIMMPIRAEVNAGRLTWPVLFSEWCVMEEPYGCMREEIQPRAVLDACWRLLGSKAWRPTT